MGQNLRHFSETSLPRTLKPLVASVHSSWCCKLCALQAQARVEEQAVQLHEKLEAKRAAIHAEKVGSSCCGLLVTCVGVE